MVGVVELENVEPGKDFVLLGAIQLEIPDQGRIVRASEEPGIKPVNFFIRKTCPCNEYPLLSVYIEELRYAGVYLVFLFMLQNTEAVLTSTHNLCFEQK